MNTSVFVYRIRILEQGKDIFTFDCRDLDAILFNSLPADISIEIERLLD